MLQIKTFSIPKASIGLADFDKEVNAFIAEHGTIERGINIKDDMLYIVYEVFSEEELKRGMIEAADSEMKKLTYAVKFFTKQIEIFKSQIGVLDEEIEKAEEGEEKGKLEHKRSNLQGRMKQANTSLDDANKSMEASQLQVELLTKE